MPARLNDHELVILKQSVAMLHHHHRAALERHVALAIIDELLELRRALDRLGAQVGELQQILDPLRAGRP